MNGALAGAKVGLVIGLVVVAIFLVLAFSRRGAVGRTRIGSRRRDVQSTVVPDQAFHALLAIGAPYRVDDSDPAGRVVILSTNPTLTTWGFFYPIEIVAGPDGGSTIHVGIQSRVFQFGPIVGHWHSKVVRAIEQHLALPAARVV